MGKDGDNILLDLLKESDQKAFKRLFYSYAEPLKTFIQYFIHNPEVAEELVLDIFTSLWENREHLDIQTSLKAYLFQAARNKVASYFRSKKIWHIWKRYLILMLLKMMSFLFLRYRSYLIYWKKLFLYCQSVVVKFFLKADMIC